MTSAPMMMTMEAHQTNLSLLKQFYLNPSLFSTEIKTNRKGSFCHLSVFGPTSHRFSGLDENCERVLCYRDIRSDLLALRNDDSIQKIFIEFDGPGGEASGCFDLANLISEIAKEKPITGFINGTSYSANYALASACSELYISAHSNAGSIGVIYGRREMIDERQQITYFKTGEAKADGAVSTTLSDAEASRHQTMVDRLGASFFDLVATNRNINAIDVKNMEANLFSAKELLSHGLVDDIKTEEEIHAMMTDANHKKVVEAIQATHVAEKTALTTQISALQDEATQQAENQRDLITKVNNLAKSANVPELAGQLIEQGANEATAATAIKEAAAKKDEEISLTSGLDPLDNESFDMQKLIEEA